MKVCILFALNVVSMVTEKKLAVKGVVADTVKEVDPVEKGIPIQEAGNPGQANNLVEKDQEKLLNQIPKNQDQSDSSDFGPWMLDKRPQCRK